MHISAATPGGCPWGHRGNSARLVDFCCQFLARDRGIGSLLHFWGKIHRERPTGFLTSPPSWKWKIWTAGTVYIVLQSKHRPKCMFVEIVILWLTRHKAEPRCVQKTGRLAIFAYCMYYCQTVLGVLSKYAPRGRDSGSFLWKNLVPG